MSKGIKQPSYKISKGGAACIKGGKISGGKQKKPSYDEIPEGC